ncbi:unnamed protein product [Strongylus vulgaris]|uniref:Histidine acid phosphatase n=1 Tax=Strongylus vulgaris TaxID=40348 RepID=A0A3P7I7C7_STRVU|nr:unnamed protein product [Strongylus vulgaris]
MCSKAGLKYTAGAIAIFVLLIALSFVILIIFKPSYDRSLLINFQPGDLKLLGVIAIFRHGARAPVDYLDTDLSEGFPNGKGELSDVSDISDMRKTSSFNTLSIASRPLTRLH